MISTRTALAAAGAFLLLAMVAPSTASATHLTDTGTGGPSVPWGFNEFWGFDAGGEWNPAQSDLEIALANAIMPPGQSAHRFFVQWRRVEFTEDLYEQRPDEAWAVTDRAYQAMQGAEPERKPVMVIHDAPDWARDPNARPPDECGCTYPPLPDHYDDWHQFVKDAVTRYPNVRAIEIWNEPNLGRFWGLNPDAGDYVEVLARAKHAVTKARSRAPVITGGLAPVSTDPPTRISSRMFLSRIYRQGCKCDFEGIGTHAFPRTEPLVDDMWNEINTPEVDGLNGLFAERDEHHDSKTPLWNTEVGVSSAPSDPPAEGVGDRQGEELVRLYHSIEGHQIKSFNIFRFHDEGVDDTFLNRTGVVNQDLSPKPAYCALGEAIGVAPPPGTCPVIP
jgi:hypothetical protein